MEVFVVKVLIESKSTKSNLCSAEVFFKYEDAQGFAEEQVKDANNSLSGKVNISLGYCTYLSDDGKEYMEISITRQQIR